MPETASQPASLLESLRSLPPKALQETIESLSEPEAAALLYDWELWARPEQLEPPGDWDTWLIMAGRGAGKTRSGAEWVRQQVAAGKRRIALVARTAADARDVIVEGESGILSVCPPWDRPEYEPSKRRLTWANGAIATTYSAEEPDTLRGPQHDAAWADELAAWKYPETWDMLQFGLRLGSRPRVVATTTPKPVRTVRDLLKSSRTVVTRGSTFDNAANLAPSFLEAIRQRYEGTRLGRQELHGELLDDVPGALWTRANLDQYRLPTWFPHDIHRIVIGLDPAVTSGEDSDMTGIVGVGKRFDGHLVAIADRSCRLSPDGWARRAVLLFDELKADCIVAEVNNGGDLVTRVIKSVARDMGRNIAVKAVSASRGKRTRAEPIAALYEQGRVHHVPGLEDLEDQMCSYTPDGYDGSPDRVDALVWAATELTERGGGGLSGIDLTKGSRRM